jgi:hypothetical protein
VSLRVSSVSAPSSSDIVILVMKREPMPSLTPVVVGGYPENAYPRDPRFDFRTQ